MALEAYYNIHPGEIVKDEVEYRGIKQRDLAAKMGISYSQLNEILNCKRPVNTEIALLFEASLGLSPKMLVGIQADYDMRAAKENSTFARRLDSIRKICAASLA
jgi:addiction module HigA family antidote